MTSARLLVAAAALSAAAPAAGQLSNRSLSVESGIYAPVGASGSVAAAVALSATVWLDGDVDAVARAGFGSAAEPGGRATDALSGTLGLRLSLLPDPVRPQLTAEIGWARAEDGDRLLFGAGAGVEAFVARDVSVALRTALRVRAGGAPFEATAEATLAFAAYF